MVNKLNHERRIGHIFNACIRMCKAPGKVILALQQPQEMQLQFDKTKNYLSEQ